MISFKFKKKIIPQKKRKKENLRLFFSLVKLYYLLNVYKNSKRFSPNVKLIANLNSEGIIM